MIEDIWKPWEAERHHFLSDRCLVCQQITTGFGFFCPTHKTMYDEGKWYDKGFSRRGGTFSNDLTIQGVQRALRRDDPSAEWTEGTMYEWAAAGIADMCGRGSGPVCPCCEEQRPIEENDYLCHQCRWGV